MKRILLLSLAAGVVGCAPDAARPPQTASAARAAPLSALEVQSYASGRHREIELISAALQMLSCTDNAEHRTVLTAGASPDRVAHEGAITAGIPVPEYRELVARVDAMLLPELNPDSVHINTDAMRRLDSLRVELTVLRARVDAEMLDTHRTSRKPCVAPR